MGVEVKQTLERHYDLVLTMTNIRKLDMKGLQLIESGGLVPETPAATTTSPAVAGEIRKAIEQNTVLERYNFDAMIPKECIVRLNLVIEGSPLFIVHPIEGHIKSLIGLAHKLKCPVYGVQVSSKAPLTSIPELGAYYVQHIKATQPNGPYRIAGYSFGAAMAFEIATELQASSKLPKAVEHLIFMDGSHNFVQTFVDDEYVRKLENNENNGQDEVDGLLLFSVQFSKFDTEKFKATLTSLPNWERRLHATADLLMETGLFKNEDDIKFAATVYYKLSYISIFYKPKQIFNGDALLIKSTVFSADKKREKDYGLSKVVSGAVDIQVVPGDHFSFLHKENVDNVAKLITQAIHL